MRVYLISLFILFTNALGNFFDDLYSKLPSFELIEKNQKTIGIISTSFCLQTNSKLYKIYTRKKKYLGNLLIHDNYISQEYENTLTYKENKRFSLITKIITNRERISVTKKKRKKDIPGMPYDLNSLHQGETLADVMDYWTKN